MNPEAKKQENAANQDSLNTYYKFHSWIYDATRWSFLFGRERIVRLLPKDKDIKTVLEIGCGTGRNLAALLKKYPQAHLIGIDLSNDMLKVARKRFATQGDQVELLEQYYQAPLARPEPFDLVLFSYALTMINPGWDAVIKHAVDDLGPGGMLAVVDFHDAPSQTFKRWMGVNHVRMDGHLLPEVKKHTTPVHEAVCNAYGGWWQYVLYTGVKE